MHASHVHVTGHRRYGAADQRMVVDQCQRYVAQHVGQVRPAAVAGVCDVLVGDGPVPGQVVQPVDGRIEKRGHGVGGALRERHVRREPAGQVRHVCHPVRVALPLRHADVSRERQQLHDRRAVLVAQRDEALVVEVLEHNQVEGRPIVPDEVDHRRFVQRQLAVERPEPPQVHGRGDEVHKFGDLQHVKI